VCCGFGTCWLYLSLRFGHISLVLHSLNDFELHLWLLCFTSWWTTLVGTFFCLGKNQLVVVHSCFIFCGWFTSGLLWFQSFPCVHRVSLRLLQEDPQRWGPPLICGPSSGISSYSVWPSKSFLLLLLTRTWFPYHCQAGSGEETKAQEKGNGKLSPV
jgi:hypothetical protein